MSLSSETSSENDDAVLLRDWNFEKFFLNRSSHPSNMVSRTTENTQASTFTTQPKRNNPSDFSNKQKLQDKIKSEIFNSNLKAHNSNVTKLKNQLPNTKLNHVTHKRQESDSKLPNFVRAFRRENTDFSLISKRHSVVLGERMQNGNESNNQLRSSAIFQRSHPKNCEPVLTDYIQKGSLKKESCVSNSITPGTSNDPNKNSGNWTNLNFLRPRREKTESVIFVRNFAARHKFLEEQQNQQHNFQVKPKICLHLI